MVSKRAKLNDPEAASQIKNRSLADTLPDLKIASQRLESLINDSRHYRGVVGLDISDGPMAPKTAEGDFTAPSNGLHYLVHHFNYIDQMALLTLAKSKTL